MTWAYQSTTATQSGSGTVAVTYPAGIQVGDTVLLMCALGFGAGKTFTASDFTPLVSRNTNNSSAILYRVVDGTEGATSNVSNSGGNNCSYAMARFTGGPTNAANFASSIVATNSRGSSGSAGLSWPNLTIGNNNNCLVVTLGTKQATLTSFDVPALWTGELTHSTGSDGGRSFVWDYLIQNTAADITSAGWTVGGDSSAANQAIIAAILPAAAPPPSGGGGTGSTAFPPPKRKTYVFYDLYYPR